jgi:LCP family protein required for cell wall assembly
MNFTVRTLSEKPKKTRSVRKSVQSLFAKKITTVEVKNNSTRTSLLKKVFIIAMATLGSLVITTVVFGAVLQLQLHNFSTLFSSIPTDKNGFINVVLVGNGGIGHDGVDLTDTIIVASIDPKKTKSAVMVSIPRDTLVTTQYFGEKSPVYGRRINSIYRDIKYDLARKGIEKSALNTEALRLFEQEIAHLTGLEIYGTVKVDFEAFEQVVDALGGIEIDVKEAIYDATYPNNNWGYEVFSISAGKQVLDGATALKYARSRHTTSDFDRSARQQQIITALAEKAKALGIVTKPNTILEIASIIREHYQSTIPLTSLAKMASLGSHFDRDRIITYQLNDRSGYVSGLPLPGGLLYPPPREEYNGASVLLPISIPASPVTWDGPQAFIRFITQYRNILLTNPSISVLNAGAISGSAREMAQDLQRYGLRVEIIENAEGLEDQETSFAVLSIPTDSEGNPIFEEKLFDPILNMYKFTVNNTMNISSEQRKILTIVVGKDFTYTPIQSLVPTL